MTKLSVQQILGGKAPADQPVTVKGWVRTRRDSKAGISFVNISDGSCFHPVQVVAPATLANYAVEIAHLTAGCAVEATGIIVPSPAKGQPFEMQASEVKVIGWVDDPDTYPIQPKAHSMEYLRDVAHLRSRTNVIGAVTRVRHTIAQAIHRYFSNDGFVWVNTPIITASDAEGAGEMFRVSTLDLANLPRNEAGKIDFTKDFFGRETFLTVSGQLNVETYCMALSKVYTFGPTFRAENSNTSRHLAEFWMIEPEIAFADLNDDANLAEDFLKYLFRAVLDERADDMAFIAERVQKDAITRLVGAILLEQNDEWAVQRSRYMTLVWGFLRQANFSILSVVTRSGRQFTSSRGAFRRRTEPVPRPCIRWARLNPNHDASFASTPGSGAAVPIWKTA